MAVRERPAINVTAASGRSCSQAVAAFTAPTASGEPSFSACGVGGQLPDIPGPGVASIQGLVMPGVI